MTQSPQLKHYYEHRAQILERHKEKYKPRLYQCQNCSATFRNITRAREHEAMFAGHKVVRLQ